MKRKISFLTLIVSALFLFGFAVFGVFNGGKDFSESERRPLAVFPKLSAENVINGNFAEDFEKYSLDHFPLRDGFRRIKALFSKYVLLQKDNNGLYIADGQLSKLDYPENLSSVKKATDRFGRIIEKYADKNQKVFFSVIPDKNFFLASKHNYPSIDYGRFFSYAKEQMNGCEYIEISDLLDETCYYRTDSHWRQEKILPVALRLAEKMGVSLDSNFTEKTLSKSFLGVYAGQSALPVETESITILENPATKNSTVFDAESNGTLPVYNLEKIEGKDMYEVFLSGPRSLLKISNPENPKGKKLVVFRDSFAGSLVPLMLSGYSEITLVDIRYISPDVLDRFVDFSGCDMLFIYSVGVLNNSETIK